MHKTMRSTFILFIILVSTLTVGCGSSVPVVKPFKMDIQQGNVVTSKMLLQLRPGMTKSQVKFIMGTPLINDSFHSNRWDYFYQMRRAGKVIEQRRVILDFEKELLVRVRGDVVPQGTPGADIGVSLSNEPSSTAKPVAKEGLLENLKFWKSNQDPEDKPADKAPVAEPKDIKPVETKSEATEQAAPATETKSVDVGPEASKASSVVESEAPSMLAVPIEIAPSEAAPAPVISPTPATVEPINAPAVITPSQVPTKIDPIEPAPEPASVKAYDQFIFRLDKDLDTQSLENSHKAPAEPSTQSKATDEKTVPAKDLGYFERMLEKIGF